MSDQGDPEKTSEALLQVTVNRDMYPPEFTGDYDQTIMVNHAVSGPAVTMVEAKDRDLKVCVSRRSVYC